MSEQPRWSPYGQQYPGQDQGRPPYRGQPPYQGQSYGPPGGQAPDPGPGYGSGSQPPPRPKRHLVRNILIVAGIAAFVVEGIVIRAISSHGSGVSIASSGHSATAPSPARSPACPVPVKIAAPAGVGSHFDVQDGNGHTYQVTLVKIIDPAESANKYNAPDPGYRLVGAVFSIKALTGRPQDENADADAMIIGSNGRTYTFNIRLIAGYTNFSDGMIFVAQHDTTTGAVTFEMPDGVKVMKVEWRADRGIGSILQWNVRR